MRLLRRRVRLPPDAGTLKEGGYEVSGFSHFGMGRFREDVLESAIADACECCVPRGQYNRLNSWTAAQFDEFHKKSSGVIRARRAPRRMPARVRC